MSDPFLAEIRIFAGNFAPNGWAFCNGQIMSIAQNTALFSLVGTTYGGNGTSTFALPNLQSRFPIHWGQGPGLSNYALGQTSGTETVTLNTNQIPVHNHVVSPLVSNTTATQSDPTAAYPAQPNAAAGRGATVTNGYTTSANGVGASFVTAAAGGSQPFGTLPPYLALSFIIALQGIYPSRS